jgi:hypothetical protein
MSAIEIACVLFSATETAVTIYLWLRYKKKLDAAIRANTIAAAEYIEAAAKLNSRKVIK